MHDKQIVFNWQYSSCSCTAKQQFHPSWIELGWVGFGRQVTRRPAQEEEHQSQWESGAELKSRMPRAEPTIAVAAE